MQVAFGSLRVKTTQPMYRLDMEQYLLFTDIDLPTSYRVDFGLSESGDTISMVGTEDGVLIPDNLLINSGTLHAWVWVDTGTYGGKTCYHAIIPVKVRGNITDIEPTPSQQTTIDTLLRAMNEAVDDSEAAAEAAEGFAENAEASADRAEQAAQSIDGKVARAEAAAQAAETAATNAEDAKDAANLFASNAAESAEAAHLSEVSAEGSASTATTKAAEASNSAAQAAASAASIEGDVQEAEQAAQQATQAANAASQSATAAQGSATAASGSATVATNKAAEASASATIATEKATEAANSATAAGTAKTGAETAQAAAEAVLESIPADYSELSDDVSELKNAFADFAESGYIDINYTLIKNSYPDMDGFHSYNNWDRTDYIPVAGGKTVYFDNTGRFSADNVWYDDNKTPISKFTVLIGTKLALTAPDNARYMVVSNSSTQWYDNIYTDQNYYATKEELSGFPSYYDSYIADKVDTINSDAPLNGLSFVFITDLHFKNNQLHSLGLIDYIIKHTATDIVLSGGDYTQAYGTQTDIDYAKAVTFQYAKALFPHWFSIRGNHDYTIKTAADTASGITESDKATYHAIVRSAADWRYSVPTPVNDILNTQYNIYKNYNWVLTNEQAKLKIIGLCDYNTTNINTYYGIGRFFTNAYASYFCQLLQECDGYNIIVLTHAALVDELGDGSTNRLTDALNAYASKTSISFGSFSFDFSAATGKIICCLSGHHHADQSAVVNGVLHIGTTCDALYQDDGYGRTAGTTSEQAFDVFTIDIDNKTIKATRIGGGSDREWVYS